MVNAGQPSDLAALQALLPPAIEAARDHLDASRARWDDLIAESLGAHLRRLATWEQLSLDNLVGRPGLHRQERIRDTATGQRRLADSLRTSGVPFLRVLAVLDVAR